MRWLKVIFNVRILHELILAKVRSKFWRGVEYCRQYMMA